jgi:hypothetical protein
MHLPFAIRFSVKMHRRMHWPCHWPANAFACGECGVFANSLKRIGKWHRANDRLGFADFNAKANGKSFSLFSLLSLSLFVIE